MRQKLCLAIIGFVGVFSLYLAGDVLGLPLDGTGLTSFGNPDAQATFITGLDGLLADWPGGSHIHGLAQVRVTATSEDAGIFRRIFIRCEDTYIDALSAGRLEVTIDLPPSEQAHLKFSLDGPAARVTADFSLDATLDLPTGHLVWGPGPLRGTIQVKEIDLARLSVAWPALALAGKAEFKASVAGTTDHPELQMNLDSKQLSWRGEMIGEATASWQQRDEEATIEVQLKDAVQPLATAKLDIPLAIDLHSGDLSWFDDRQHKLKLSAHGLTPSRLKPFWHAPAGADFLLDFDLSGEGTLDQPVVSGTLMGTLGTTDFEPVPIEGTLGIGADRQSCSLVVGDKLIDLFVETGLPLVALRRQKAPVSKASVGGTFNSKAPLSLLAPYLPQAIDSPEGDLESQVQIGGTLGKPSFMGKIWVRDAIATLLPIQRRLEEIAIEVNLSGDRMEIERLDALCQPGHLSGHGEVGLVVTSPESPADAPPWSHWKLEGNLEAEFIDFPVVRQDLPVSLIKGTVMAGVKAGPDEALWRVAFGASELEFTEEKVPRARAVPINPAVTILDFLNRPVNDAELLAGGGHHRIEIELKEPVKVKGDGIDIDLAGTLTIDRLGDVVRVDGGIDLQPGGRFKLFDNRFEIQAGRLALAEGHLGRLQDPCELPGTPGCPERDPDAPITARPLDPILDITARGLVANTHVLVKVRGASRRPELMLISVPGLPEYQILTLLIMGRIDVVDDRDGEVRREAAAIVDRFNNPGLKQQLFDKLGVDNVGFGFGSSASQPIVTVGKQVTRTLFVETTYRVNAPPDVNEREAHIMYSVDTHWSIDTLAGDAGEGRLGVFWATRFGGPPPPEAPPKDWGVTVYKERGDADGDGIADPFDLCEKEAEDIDGFEDMDGCPDPDNDHDGLADSVDQAPNEAETFNGFQDDDGIPDQPPRQLQQFRASIRGFPFPIGGATLSREGRMVLAAAADLLQGLPWLQVEISGHADDQGSPGSNRAVSLRRAQVAKATLVAGGMSKSSISIIGVGADRPIDTGTDEKARARNRRVELTITGELEPIAP